MQSPLSPDVEAECSSIDSTTDDDSFSFPSSTSRAREVCEDSQPLVSRAARAFSALFALAVLLAAFLAITRAVASGKNTWLELDGTASRIGSGQNTLLLYENKPEIPRYEQAFHCYCGRDDKIGRTYRGVGKKRCQALCTEDPKCVAFEMYKSGNDCTLRPHCPNPRASLIGTYLVLFAHRNNGTLYPPELARLCSSTGHMPTLQPSALLPMLTVAPPASNPTPAPGPPEHPSTTEVAGWRDIERPMGGPEATGGATTTQFPSTTTPVETVEPVQDRPRFLPDWGLVGGGSGDEASTTTPKYKLMQEGYNGLSPPFSGPRVVQSASCGKAVEMLWNKECELGSSLWQFRTTCQQPLLQDWRASCKRWSGVLGKPEFDSALVEACINNVDRIEKKSWLGNFTPSSSLEEARLCFSCESVTCVVRAGNWDPDIIRTGHLPDVKPPSEPRTIGRWDPDGSSNHCKPTENGKVVGIQRRLRRELHLWSDEDWEKFASAVNLMKANGRYAAFANNFTKRLYPDQPEFTLLQSLPWNRRFLLDFETELQHFAGDCNLALPFWSSSLEASPEALRSSVIWFPSRLGGRPHCPGGEPCALPEVTSGRQGCFDKSRYCLGDGLADGWIAQATNPQDLNGCSCVHRSPKFNASLPSHPALFRYLAESTDLLSLSSRLDAFMAAMHCQVTGTASTLCSPNIAAWDPLFILIRTNLDRLFMEWQRFRHEKYRDTTTSCSGCQQLMTLYGQPLAEMLGAFDASDSRHVQLPKSNPAVSMAYSEGYDPEIWIGPVTR